ncbi:Kinesin-like protein KIF19 [Myotis davidii]|uniref:Kinesin-like protein KIF19 n=1 Tax=Myotis davidii TaxID=225400 RepID=L5MFG0_MYODS|nr:Kinesin-like protein KIF19 [Myotis davidii]
MRGLDPGWALPLSRCREKGDSDQHQVHLGEGCPEALQGPGSRGAPPAGTGHGAQHPVPALAESPLACKRPPSPTLQHAASEDNLSSSTGEAPPPAVGHRGEGPGPWLRAQKKGLGKKQEESLEAKRRKRRSRSFEVTGQRAPGFPPHSLLPPIRLVFPDGLPVGPACPTAQAPMAKTDASGITEGPCLEPALLPQRLNGV